MSLDKQHSLITYFPQTTIEGIALPERFTFPFYYEPHPLTRIAAEELQQYLETPAALDHNFGLEPGKEGLVIGKMFGILVVQDAGGRVGYLSAFSGKLAGSNQHPRFVPPVFDMLVENSFFLLEQEVINQINISIEEKSADSVYLQLKDDEKRLIELSLKEIGELKQSLKKNKEARRKLRESQQSVLELSDYEQLETSLVNQSLYEKRQLRDLVANWEHQFSAIREQLNILESAIEALKQERKERSAMLQQQLFDQYQFLNQYGQTKSLQDIFSKTTFGKPPSAAGECATPKLLQFAFANGYRPLAMAEFWWGASPKSEIRKHKQFYPACTGKCKPILAHMLEGIPMDENPFLHVADDSVAIEILYEDESFVVVNKPFGLRSVPGVDVVESVYSVLRQRWTDIEPLIVHRLDMDTSGILVVAKTQGAHRHLQKQFLHRTVNKRYVALLAGVLVADEGAIDLPLAADPFNRPRQIVCFETGKKTMTKWKVIYRKEGVTKVYFWPHTGRTHQLRMHAAHELGLNAPIVGDDLYGTGAARMYLHAASLEFTHPRTKERMSFLAEEGF